nr:equilibrative nucleotide transporter 8-like [Tanacetum cinerariifolium]
MESFKNNPNQTKPKDTYKIAYMIHFLLGAGNLLPWNALITAIDYFGYLYPDKHVEKVFSVAYMSSSLLVLIVMIRWNNFSELLTFQVRMNIGFAMFVMSLMVTPTIDWAWQGVSKVQSDAAFCAVVASVWICGLADGLIGGSLIGSAGKLPKEYMQAVFAGTASSGILVSFLRIITKASLPHNPQGLKKIMEQHYKLLQHNSSPSRPKFWDVARMIRWPALGIFIIYTVTLSIFPGFLAENIKSELLKDWYPIMLIATYNMADFAGKSFTAIYVLESITKATWGCMGRLLLYPLFTACLHGPVWLKNEVFVVFLTVILGFTNGYLTSVIMMLAPKSVPPSEAEMAAVVMALFLGLGLVSGSVLGWFWII